MRPTPRSLIAALAGLVPACSYPVGHFHSPGCLGEHLLEGVCLATVPTGDIALSAAIDTARSGPGGCTEIVVPDGRSPVCVVAAATIRVPGGIQVRVTAQLDSPTATGTPPLVLFATDSIVIDGSLDVASHRGPQARGSGARTAIGCAAPAADGRPGEALDASSAIGGGGAAGGSFGSAGGPGGSGGNGTRTAAAGTARIADPFVTVVGGCPGGNGGHGNAAPGNQGIGGEGGGAVYLLAGNSIAIAGRIDASGAGGGAGAIGLATVGNSSSGGGGGGGAGGLIALEASAVSVTGSLLASGGGGGAGFGGLQGPGGAAADGADPSTADAPAHGGTANNGGGAGGNGSLRAAEGEPGKPGANAPGDTTPESGGGGGGGGAGAICVFSSSPPRLGSSISPPPTGC